MLSLPPSVRVFLCLESTDMRKATLGRPASTACRPWSGTACGWTPFPAICSASSTNPATRSRCICQDEPRRALESASPFEAQGVGSGLAAQIIISKHEDHLPLNRQEKILERQGILLSKSHRVDIIAHAHDLVQGIVEPIRKEVLSSTLVGMDELPVNVLDETLKGESHRGYFWTMGSQDAVVYRFDAGRSGQNITALLGEGYSGYVVADGFSAYDPKSRPRSYTLINCWAHVRGKFFEIMKDQPIAREGVNRIAAMYHLESEARKNPDPLTALAETRRTLIGPLLDAFRDWLAERETFVLPKSSLGAAIHYALERKAALEKFLDDPRIPIDKNQSERDLRHVVIGRKNWNFAGSYAGAERLATFFTLMQSCKRVKLNPWVYLTHVFSVTSPSPQRPLISAPNLHGIRWKGRSKNGYEQSILGAEIPLGCGHGIGPLR